MRKPRRGTAWFQANKDAARLASSSGKQQIEVAQRLAQYPEWMLFEELLARYIPNSDTRVMLDDCAWFTPFIETYTSEKLPWVTTPGVHGFEKFPAFKAYEDLAKEYAAQLDSQLPVSR